MTPADSHDPLDVTQRASYPTAAIALGIAGSCGDPACCEAHVDVDRQFLDGWLTSHAAMANLPIYPPPGEAATALRRNRAATRQCATAAIRVVLDDGPDDNPATGFTIWPAA